MGLSVASCSVQDCARCSSISIAADSQLAKLTIGFRSASKGAMEVLPGAAGAHQHHHHHQHHHSQDMERAVACGIGTQVRDFEDTAREFITDGRAEQFPGQAGAGLDKDRSVQERLFQASREGNFKRVVEALAQGADVHAQTLRGQTALMLAAASHSKGVADVMRFLLDTMSDLESKDENGWTPLLHACRNNQQEAAALLLERNASLRARATDGSTCAMLAAKDGGDNLVMDLVGRQAAVDKKDDRGWTVLFVAAYGGRSDLVKWLIRKEANVKDRASDGATALMAAACSGHKRIGERLYKKGCSINATNMSGDTALILAVKAGNEDFAFWLVETGCEVGVRNNNDEDAYDLASDNCMFALRQKIEQCQRSHEATDEKH